MSHCPLHLVAAGELVDAVALQRQLSIAAAGPAERLDNFLNVFAWAMPDNHGFASAEESVSGADAAQIEKDVHRTAHWLDSSAGAPVAHSDDNGSTLTEPRRLEMVHTLLTAHSAWCMRRGGAEVTYLQGMNGVAYTALCACLSAADVANDGAVERARIAAFRILAGFTAAVLPTVFSGGAAADPLGEDPLERTAAFFVALVKEVLPGAAAVVEAASVPLTAICYKWFLTAFTDVRFGTARERQLPYATLLAAWDVCAVLGTQGAMLVSLALLLPLAGGGGGDFGGNASALMDLSVQDARPPDPNELFEALNADSRQLSAALLTERIDRLLRTLTTTPRHEVEPSTARLLAMGRAHTARVTTHLAAEQRRHAQLLEQPRLQQGQQSAPAESGLERGHSATPEQQQPLPFMHYTLRERLAAARRSARSAAAVPPPKIDTSEAWLGGATVAVLTPGSATPTAIRGFRLPTPPNPATAGTPRALSGGITPRAGNTGHHSISRVTGNFFSFPSPSPSPATGSVRRSTSGSMRQRRWQAQLTINPDAANTEVGASMLSSRRRAPAQRRLHRPLSTSSLRAPRAGTATVARSFFAETLQPPEQQCESAHSVAVKNADAADARARARARSNVSLTPRGVESGNTRSALAQSLDSGTSAQRRLRSAAAALSAVREFAHHQQRQQQQRSLGTVVVDERSRFETCYRSFEGAAKADEKSTTTPASKLTVRERLARARAKARHDRGAAISSDAT